jgi:hypothetical protein
MSGNKKFLLAPRLACCFPCRDDRGRQVAGRIGGGADPDHKVE